MKETFTAVLWKEGSWYIAQCREFEIASQGKTKEEAMESLSEAIEVMKNDVARTHDRRLAAFAITAILFVIGTLLFLRPFSTSISGETTSGDLSFVVANRSAFLSGTSPRCSEARNRQKVHCGGNRNTSRTYVVCLDCGTKMDYDLAVMRIASPRSIWL